jgi:hypothetical protein
MRILPTLIAVVLAITVYASPEVGKPAPDFTLSDLSGKKHELSEYMGKYVVLEWVNFGCPFVKKHYGSENMQKLQKEFGEQDVVWLSICSSAPGKQGNETPDAAKEGISKYGWAASAYLVREGGLVYGVRVAPSRVEVDVSRSARTGFLGAFGIRSVEISARSASEPRHGVFVGSP